MVAARKGTQHSDRLAAAELATRPSTTLADTSTDVEDTPRKPACVKASGFPQHQSFSAYVSAFGSKIVLRSL